MTAHLTNYGTMRRRMRSSTIDYVRTIFLFSLLVILSPSANRVFTDHRVNGNTKTIQAASAFMFKFRRRRQHLFSSQSLSLPLTTLGAKKGSSPSSLSSSPSSSNTDISKTISPTVWIHQLKVGYDRRVAADPSFKSKSITEVLLAATTQLMAEWNRRGADRLLLEFDFVFPAILAAVFGKYYRYDVTLYFEKEEY
mmetsp:Transcript_50678/g.122262  ORF Transcript_50678/g.122262 Transcript_50678/m.122262 type:complete len:196 (+) Transcript_50678:97-684(+)